MSALDDRIERIVAEALRKERAFTRQVVGQVLGELMIDINARLGKTNAAVDEAGDNIRELFNNKPDADGVIRKQWFTPRPR
jgi:hypothetical protein